MDVSTSQLNEVVTYGKLYYPAESHYAHKSIVVCDRCNKTRLKVCVGYKNFDLCMKCVDKVVDNINELFSRENKKEPLVRMMSDKFFESLRNKK